MNIFLVLSYSRLSLEKKTDWLKRAKGLNTLYEYWQELNELEEETEGKDVSLMIHREEIRILKISKNSPPPIDDIYHLVIIPISKETQEIIEPGIVSIVEGNFSSRKILIILAVEEWASPVTRRSLEVLHQKYQNRFLDLLITVHPQNIPGEGRTKGANATHAAKKAAEYFTQKGINFENIIVSCFDAYTVISPDYFSCLTYRYMVSPTRTQASFQPIPVYYNNIWDVPGFARVLDVGSSFFQLIEATNPDNLVTFSSHSMSFKALVEIGYWPRDMISDDSAIFWKSFIYFNGKYNVIPMYITLSMDVTAGGSWLKTIANVYKQKRRWAWGVENFPIVMRAFLNARYIPLGKRLKHAFRMFESHVSWATWPFLLTFIGWLPALFAGREFSHSILYYTAPRITAIIFGLASLGLIVCVVLSLLLLPKHTENRSIFKRIIHALDWIFLPFVSIFLSALPALDAQTRLMLGRYMEFWITTKRRKNSES